MPKATCCKDKEHCCPSDLPVCDTDGGRCLPPSTATGAAALRSAPWATKTPARRKAAPADAGFFRGRGKGGSGARFISEGDDGMPFTS